MNTPTNPPKKTQPQILIKLAGMACLAAVAASVFTGCRSAYRVVPVANYSSTRPDIFRYPHEYFINNSVARTKDVFMDNVPYHINPMIYRDNSFGTNSLYLIASSEGRSLYLPKVTVVTTSKHHKESAVTNYSSTLRLVSAEDARLARNRLQNTLLAIAYENGGQHSAGIKATENFANLLLGGTTIGLSAGATVAAETTAKALTAAAAGTAGARSLFNEETFRNNLAETMFQSMNSARELYRATNILVMQLKPVSEYDVAAAIHDAEVYNEMASFYYQLSIVIKDTGEATKVRNDSVQAALDAVKNSSSPSQIAKFIQSSDYNVVLTNYNNAKSKSLTKQVTLKDGTTLDTSKKGSDYAQALAKESNHSLEEIMTLPNLFSEFQLLANKIISATTP